MADDVQDKTEEPTFKKLTEARNKGQVAKSQDFTTAILLMSAIVALYFYATPIFGDFINMTLGVFTHLQEPFDDISSASFWLNEGIKFIFYLLAPFFAVIFVAAFLVNAFQVGIKFSHHPLIPKFKNLNIFDVSNYKKFFNVSAIMRLLFGLVKFAVVGAVVFCVIYFSVPEISTLMLGGPKDLLTTMLRKASTIGVLITLILMILGIGDIAFQKWKFLRDMKMTKQEVKEERKQSEGDAQVKGKMKSMMHTFAHTRMKANVPHSDVVVSNPIEYAIAVKYDPEQMAAPVCLAKGARKMAIAIKEIAQKNKIPIVENPVLARGLYRGVEVGEQIPPQFYHGIAEVLAYVYRLNEKMGKGNENPTMQKSSKKEEMKEKVAT